MCCRVGVYGEDIDHDEVRIMLELAGFEETNGGHWEHQFPHLNGKDRHILAKLFDKPHGLSFHLVPSLLEHDFYQHQDSALMASMSFKLAAIIGERYNASVVHEARVGMCKDTAGGGPQNITMAVYPSKRLEFDQICMGFQRVLEKGVKLEPEQDA